jgi:UPF0755 protein
MRTVRKIVFPIVFCTVVLCIALFFTGFNAPVDREGSSILFKIEHGEHLHEITGRLEAAGMIRSELFFTNLVRISRSSKKVKSGVYDLHQGMRSSEVLRVITMGIVSMEKFTIPEGLHMKQVSKLLAEQGVVGEKEFVLACSSERILQKYKIPFDSVEGFIFPDTYIVAKDLSAEQIVEITVERFFEALKEVPLRDFSAEQLKRIVIVASLVEKEAKLDEERPLVAAVFYNRLDKGKRLEACSTIQYILGKTKERLLYSDLKISSPYNTYRNGGLPPGPIASPGLNSLRAAVQPADVDYLFFVSKNDGSHHFSSSYEEHLKAIERYGGATRFTNHTS